MKILAIIVLVVAIVLLVLFFGINARKQKLLSAKFRNGKASIKCDFDTPEGAAICLDNALRKKDIDAAVACHDFFMAAKLMLKSHDNPLADDSKIVAETSEVLEQSYRVDLGEKWPDFTGIEVRFSQSKTVSKGLVEVTEILRYPDGWYGDEKLLVYKTANGWRVLNPID